MELSLSWSILVARVSTCPRVQAKIRVGQGEIDESGKKQQKTTDDAILDDEGVGVNVDGELGGRQQFPNKPVLLLSRLDGSAPINEE